MRPRRAPSPTAAEASFEPPFCPNPDCRFHAGETSGWRFVRRGYRAVERRPGRIRRFRCRSCGRWFSSSTFREDYWKRKAGLSGPVYHLIADGKALRQAARTLRVSVSTVRRRQRWIARQALLVHLGQRRRLAGRLREPVVFDGLRTFAGSQHEVAELNTAVGARSGYLLDVEGLPLRRMGRMTASQKKERARRERRRGRPDPRARQAATRRALERLAGLLPAGEPLRLRTDEEPDYVRAVSELRDRLSVRHVRVSARRRRDETNPLWRVNHLHRVMRHSLASLKRETIAHCKRLGGLTDRTLVHMCWLNNTKGVSERLADRARTTPAMRLGLEARPLRGDTLFARRRFPGRHGLTEDLRGLYEGRVTRPGERLTAFVPRFAY